MFFELQPSLARLPSLFHLSLQGFPNLQPQFQHQYQTLGEKTSLTQIKLLTEIYSIQHQHLLCVRRYSRFDLNEVFFLFFTQSIILSLLNLILRLQLINMSLQLFRLHFFSFFACLRVCIRHVYAACCIVCQAFASVGHCTNTPFLSKSSRHGQPPNLLVLPKNSKPICIERDK